MIWSALGCLVTVRVGFVPAGSLGVKMNGNAFKGRGGASVGAYTPVLRVTGSALTEAKEARVVTTESTDNALRAVFARTEQNYLVVLENTSSKLAEEGVYTQSDKLLRSLLSFLLS